MQEAASVASDDVGYGLKDIPRTGVHWILTGWRVELLARPLWRASLRVATWPRTLEGFLSDRDFFVWQGEELVARASSSWVLMDAETGKIVRVSDEVRSAYEVEERAVFEGKAVPRCGVSPEGAPVTFRTVVGRRDIDTNHHVNNLRYLDYALEALPEEVYQNLPATVEIVFRKQILFGTPIRCLYSLTEDGKHQVEIQSGDGKIVHHAFVWFS